MTWNFAHLHLLLNHFPVIGTIIGLGLFLVSWVEKNDQMRRASLLIFAAVALLTIPTFISGIGAQRAVMKAGVPDALIKRHEGSAMLSLWFMEALGALALTGLWESYRAQRPARWNTWAVLLFSVLTVALIARTGNTGGDVGHPEIRASQDAAEGTVGSLLRAFEPSPDKFSGAMNFSNYMTAFLMDLHFMGLVLIIGIVGILDIRIMGFARQMPMEPLHRLVPWALVGLGINVVTGMLAFIGTPEYYTYNVVLWLKILALLLLGLNAAVFYLAGIFDDIKRLGAGEDAPLSAKLVAASSLFLWISVITLGRYIQLFANSIDK